MSLRMRVRIPISSMGVESPQLGLLHPPIFSYDLRGSVWPGRRRVACKPTLERTESRQLQLVTTLCGMDAHA